MTRSTTRESADPSAPHLRVIKSVNEAVQSSKQSRNRDQPSKAEGKSRRLTIELNHHAAELLQNLQDDTGYSATEVIRNGLKLYNLLMSEEKLGRHFKLVDKNNREESTRILL